MKKANRAAVILTEQSTLREIRSVIKPRVKLARIFEKAYWAAWDKGSDCVYVSLKKAETVDGEARLFILPMPWFTVQEVSDDA